jgi:hypothetical protein
MTTEFCVAYKNSFTAKCSPQTNGWVRTTVWGKFSDTMLAFDAIKADYPNSAVGIFSFNQAIETPWFYRRPRYLHNRHVIFSGASVRQAFGGLINSRSSADL